MTGGPGQRNQHRRRKDSFLPWSSESGQLQDTIGLVVLGGTRVPELVIHPNTDWVRRRGVEIYKFLYKSTPLLYIYYNLKLI